MTEKPHEQPRLSAEETERALNNLEKYTNETVGAVSEAIAKLPDLANHIQKKLEELQLAIRAKKISGENITFRDLHSVLLTEVKSPIVDDLPRILEKLDYIIKKLSD